MNPKIMRTLYAAKEQGFRHLAFCKSPADNLHPGSWLGTLESTFHLSSCFPSHQDAQNTLLCKDGFYRQAENFIGWQWGWIFCHQTLDRETRAGNNTRHFPESRTIKLVVSVTFIGTRDHGLLTRQWQAQRGDMAPIRGQYWDHVTLCQPTRGGAFLKQTHKMWKASVAMCPEIM